MNVFKKTNVFLLGTAALLMTACSENEVLERNNEAITFDTYVGRQVRASETTINNLDQFGVYSYVNTTPEVELMQNEVIKKSGSTWTYDNPKYWPENNLVNFFAYAPLNSIGNYNSTNKTFTYTVKPAANIQEDLIAATAIDKDKNINGGKVNLMFKHLMSKIGFNAKADRDYDPTKITVTGLKVKYTADKINSQGTFTFNTTNDSRDGSAGTWAVSSTDKLSGESGELIITDGVEMTNSSQVLNAANSFLMMLPQSVETGGLEAEITYIVAYENPTAEVTNVKSIKLPAVEWQIGKAYTYNFTISMSQIIFDGITVSEWIDGTQPGDSPVPPTVEP